MHFAWPRMRLRLAKTTRISSLSSCRSTPRSACCGHVVAETLRLRRKQVVIEYQDVRFLGCLDAYPLAGGRVCRIGPVPHVGLGLLADPARHPDLHAEVGIPRREVGVVCVVASIQIHDT